MQRAGTLYEPLKNKVLGMVFEKSSTRTRVSFEAGMIQFGGSSIFLSPRDTQLGRGEPIEDTARVLSRMVDCVMIRTYEHEKIERFAEYSQVPVINALTDLHHPCQLLADMQTYFEHARRHPRPYRGLDRRRQQHVPLLHSSRRLFDFTLRIACPEGYEPDGILLNESHTHTVLLHDPMSAARSADLVVTDVWASMGQEQEQIATRTCLRALPGQRAHDGASQARRPVHALPARPPR